MSTTHVTESDNGTSLSTDRFTAPQFLDSGQPYSIFDTSSSSIGTTISFNADEFFKNMENIRTERTHLITENTNTGSHRQSTKPQSRPITELPSPNTTLKVKRDEFIAGLVNLTDFLQDYVELV